MTPVLECTRLGCARAAVNQIAPPSGRPWFGCTRHTPQMVEALKMGQGMNAQVEVTRLSRLAGATLAGR